MNKIPKKQAIYWLKVAVVGIALGFGLQFVRAWTEPTTAPPGGNVGAPINTSATAQTKSGNLNVNGGMLIGASTTGGNKGAGTINADQVCIRGVCQTAWPSGTTPASPPPPCECTGYNWGIPTVYSCGSSVLTCTIAGDCGVYTCVSPGVWV